VFSKWFHKTKIELFVRHCHFSEVSQHKERFSNFSREACHANLMQTLDSRVNVTFLLDTFRPIEKPHFITQEQRFPVVEISEGTEGGAFLRLLDYVVAKRFSPETIIYFLEDDYLHRKGWVDVLLEGFTLPDISYVTLYDHKDKYFLPCYQELASKLYHTASCHWRETPSTTNTYAMRFETLIQHLDTHRAFSLNRKITADHDKFCALRKQGGVLVSSIPGWATHMEPAYASPCIDWGEIVTSV